MTPKEQAMVARRARGRMSRDRGMMVEKMIGFACDFYRENEIADIEKTPEPMQPTKDLGGGKFIAHYTEAAQADYKGFIFGTGRAVNFEVKHTDNDRMDQKRVTAAQAERLERAHHYGAISFVLCSFGGVAFYRIPWPVWRDMKEHFGHKYITPEQAEPYRVRLRTAGPICPMFLDNPERRG